MKNILVYSQKVVYKIKQYDIMDDVWQEQEFFYIRAFYSSKNE